MYLISAASSKAGPVSYTHLDVYKRQVFTDSQSMIVNTLKYCLMSAGLDIVLGTAIAYLIYRTQLPARQWLDYIASIALAIPGLVLAIGYLRLFKGVNVPLTDTPMVATWFLIMMAYAVRRLPYALRSCMAALQQVHVSLEEAANSLGAGKISTARRVMVPLMAGGILAGFVTSFITAAVELSATLLLTSSESQAPMSYGIYPVSYTHLDVYKRQPKEWADLVKPEYFNHVAMSSPSRSGTTHLTVETILQGEGWEKGWSQMLQIAGNCAAVTDRSFAVPDGVNNGQYGVGLVIDFFGLAGKASGYPVEFHYPSVTAVVPANIALVAGAKNVDEAKQFI